MATFDWNTPGTLTSLLTTELNSLANSTSESTGKVLGAEIDNSSAKKPFLLFNASLASIISGSGSPYIAAWILYAVDGTNYPDGSTSVDPACMQPILVPLKASYTGAQNPNSVLVGLLPYKFKLLVQNKAGAALASSGNVIKYALLDHASF